MHNVIANKLGALGLLVSDAIEGALGELSPSAAALLLTLRYHPGMTITELAQVAGIAQPTAVRVLDGLARRGLVERGARVGRKTPLVLTQAGKKQAEMLQAARLRAMDRLLGILPGQERRRFEQLLDMILTAATTSRGFARITCRLCDHRACAGALCPIGSRATEFEHAISEPAR